MSSQLVFLHGFGEDARIWDDFIPFFSWSHDPIIPSYAHWTSAKSMADYAQQVFYSLPKEGHFVLVGHSMGGYIALEMARQFPDRIEKVILLHSTALPDTAEKQINRDRTAEFLQKHGASIFIKSFVANLFAPDFVLQHQELLDSLIARYENLSAEGLIASTRAMRDRLDFTSLLTETAIPFLFIHGDKDPLISTESILTIKAHHKCVILPGVGHQGVYEAPQACYDAIQSFIADECPKSL
jgi:pimeloyl-ACP methyl ester carboxylesterase